MKLGIEEVQHYVRDAINAKYTLRPLGHLHSTSGMICDTNGYAVVFDSMAQILQIDTDAKTVTVQPG